MERLRTFQHLMRTSIAIDYERSRSKISNNIEKELADRIPNLERVTFHLEEGESHEQMLDVTEIHSELTKKIKVIVESKTPARDCHGIVVTDDKSGFTISLDCRVDPEMSLGDSHEIAELVEAAIKKAFENVVQVFVHIEPEEVEFRQK